MRMSLAGAFNGGWPTPSSSECKIRVIFGRVRWHEVRNGGCVAARKYDSSFEEECARNFHDQERVSRISGIVPIGRRSSFPSPTIPRTSTVVRLAAVGGRTPPLLESQSGVERSIPFGTLLGGIACLLSVIVALAVAHYL
jgi:hypothetical protein